MTNCAGTLWTGIIISDPNCNGCGWLEVEINSEGDQVLSDDNVAEPWHYEIETEEHAVNAGEEWLGCFPSYEECGRWQVGPNEGEIAMGTGGGVER